MKFQEFAEALNKFVEQAKDAGIPLQDIVSELEDLQHAIEEEIDEDKDPEDEDEEKEEE